MIVLVVVTAAGMDVRSSIGKRLFSVFKAMALLWAIQLVCFLICLIMTSLFLLFGNLSFLFINESEEEIVDDADADDDARISLFVHSV